MRPETKITLFTAGLMSGAMSLFFAGVFTFLAFGPGPEWLFGWARGVAIGWPTGFALALAIGPWVRRAALRLAGLPRR